MESNNSTPLSPILMQYYNPSVGQPSNDLWPCINKKFTCYNYGIAGFTLVIDDPGLRIYKRIYYSLTQVERDEDDALNLQRYSGGCVANGMGEVNYDKWSSRKKSGKNYVKGQLVIKVDKNFVKAPFTLDVDQLHEFLDEIAKDLSDQFDLTFTIRDLLNCRLRKIKLGFDIEHLPLCFIQFLPMRDNSWQELPSDEYEYWEYNTSLMSLSLKRVGMGYYQQRFTICCNNDDLRSYFHLKGTYQWPTLAHFLTCDLLDKMIMGKVKRRVKIGEHLSLISFSGLLELSKKDKHISSMLMKSENVLKDVADSILTDANPSFMHNDIIDKTSSLLRSRKMIIASIDSKPWIICHFVETIIQAIQNYFHKARDSKLYKQIKSGSLNSDSFYEIDEFEFDEPTTVADLNPASFNLAIRQKQVLIAKSKNAADY